METQFETINAFNTDDALGTSDLVDLKQKLLKGECSATELVRAAISRAENVNGELNAIVVKAFDKALEESSNIGDHNFSGIPTFVKDTDDAKGLTTSLGSAAIKPRTAKKDSSFVKQLKHVGLINLGKSTTPEFGLTGTTEAVLQGPTRNPWNRNFTPGGSSGGACALVASGVVPIAHANDGAGSIRIPASCCGLIGLKPTRGRTALVDGSKILPVNILHQGVVTRSVRDTAAFYEALENSFENKALPAVGRVAAPSKKRVRIALIDEGADADCSLAVTQAAKLLETAGHHVEPIRLPFDQNVLDDFFILWSGMAFTLHRFGSFFTGRGFDRTKTEPLTKGLANDFSKQILKAPKAFRRLKQFGHEYEKFFMDYDCLLTPTLGHAVPELGYLSTTQPYEESLARAREFFPFTPYQNISGAPAISMPITRSNNGVPIGVQLAGAWGQDKLLLELAYEFEMLSNWKQLYEL